MSRVNRVTVLCPNGKRHVVNLLPNSNTLQILEEACHKENLNPDDFDLCHYNKPMDLTLPIRFVNLPNNAQLELQPVKVARKDCLVTVGLQLESGERIMRDFVPSTSIWDVAEQCLNSKLDKITSEKNVEPVCIYMRQKIVGDMMKKTTLRGLGLTKGAAIIRLLYRNPEDFSDQAHISAPLSKPSKDLLEKCPIDSLSSDISEMECDTSTEKSNLLAGNDLTNQNTILDTSNTDTSINNTVLVEQKDLCSTQTVIRDEVKEDSNENVTSIEKTDKVLNIITNANESVEQKMDLDSVAMDQDALVEEEIGVIHYIGGRHAVLYSLDDITEVKKAELPDEFFELTIDDVKYLMEEYKKSKLELENQPLLTKELRKRQLLQKLGRFKETVIRVYFPERLILQAVFEVQETVQDICDFVRNYLEDKSLNFYLYTTPPKEKKDPSKTLIESMLIPASVVYFGCEKQNKNYLEKSLREKVSDPRAAAVAAYEHRKKAICEPETESGETNDEVTMNLEEAETDNLRVPGPSFSQPSSSRQTNEKVPKWLKLSKK